MSKVHTCTHNCHAALQEGVTDEPVKGMVLPFQPLSLTFQNMSYFVNMPKVQLPASGSSSAGQQCVVGPRIMPAGRGWLSDALSSIMLLRSHNLAAVHPTGCTSCALALDTA